MDTDLLKCDKQIVEFPGLPIMAGVTTNLMGDFKFNSSGIKQRIEILKHLIGAEYHGQLVPTHRTVIPKLITGHMDEVASGDATIYGNEKIGYIAMIHCSWITLGEDILFHVFNNSTIREFRKLENLGAFIYPGICSSCYEVGHDVLGKLMNGNTYTDPYFQFLGNEKWLCNLSGHIRAALISHAVPPDSITTISTCSAHSTMEVTSIKVTQPAFFSYRARQDNRRNAIFAKLPDDDKLILSITGDCPYVILYALPK